MLSPADAALPDKIDSVAVGPGRRLIAQKKSAGGNNKKGDHDDFNVQEAEAELMSLSSDHMSDASLLSSPAHIDLDQLSSEDFVDIDRKCQKLKPDEKMNYKFCFFF